MTNTLLPKFIDNFFIIFFTFTNIKLTVLCLNNWVSMCHLVIICHHYICKNHYWTLKWTLLIIKPLFSLWTRKMFTSLFTVYSFTTLTFGAGLQLILQLVSIFKIFEDIFPDERTFECMAWFECIYFLSICRHLIGLLYVFRVRMAT